MRDLILAVVILGSLPFAFLRPYVGIYLWYWVGLMNPHRFTWNFMYSFPVALVVGLATALGSIFVRRRAPLIRSPEIVLLLALNVLFTINTAMALFPTAWGEWEKVMKVLFMTYFTVVLIDERSKLRMLLIVVVLSIGFVAVKGAIWGVFTGAQYRLWGPEGSTLGDNNSMGLALNMVLPISLFLARSEKRLASRLLFYVVFLCSIFGVILSYSRGALLGLAPVLAMLVFRARKNILFVFILLAAFGAILAFTPSSWFDRMGTIRTYEEDESAMLRIQTWHFAWDLAVQRPFTGGGFDGFRANPSNQNPHSIYFGMLGEQGFIAFGLFLVLLVTCYQSLGKVARFAARRPELTWYADCAKMLRISLVGYAFSGAFLNLQYFDLFYLIVALSAILRYLVSSDPAGITATEPGAADPAPSWPGTPSWPLRGSSPVAAPAPPLGT
jgi:probable O-glycosylation ligase (exosortase A-associated)